MPDICESCERADAVTSLSDGQLVCQPCADAHDECARCHEPVKLNWCMSDDAGRHYHESCYSGYETNTDY